MVDWDFFDEIIGCPPGAFCANSQTIPKSLRLSHAALPKGHHKSPNPSRCQDFVAGRRQERETLENRAHLARFVPPPRPPAASSAQASPAKACGRERRYPIAGNPRPAGCHRRNMPGAMIPRRQTSGNAWNARPPATTNGRPVRSQSAAPEFPPGRRHRSLARVCRGDQASLPACWYDTDQQ